MTQKRHGTHDVFIFFRRLRLRTCYSYLFTTYYFIPTYYLLHRSTYCPLLPKTNLPFHQLLRFFASVQTPLSNTLHAIA